MARTNARRFSIGLVLVCVLCGCWSGNPRGRVAVSGKVTLDGQPLDQGNIVFVPQGDDAVGSGAVIANGEYQIGVLKGLPPGKYLVRIFSTGASTIDTMALRGDMPPPGVERVAPRYNVQSETIIEVTGGDGDRFDFDVESK